MASIRSAPRRQISSRARTNSWRASSVAATLSIGVPPFAGVTTPVSPINDRPEGTPRPSPGPASTTFVHTSPQLGMAYYRLAELHRLRGEFEEAEDAYRDAGDRRQRVEPGLSLLRSAQGRADPATTGIRRALAEARTHVPRAKVLPAYVDIMLAADEVAAAHAAADELSEIAEGVGAPLLLGLAAHARAAVLLAEGDPAPLSSRSTGRGKRGRSSTCPTTWRVYACSRASRTASWGTKKGRNVRYRALDAASNNWAPNQIWLASRRSPAPSDIYPVG